MPAGAAAWRLPARAQAWQRLGFDPIVPLLPAHSWHEALATPSVLAVSQRSALSFPLRTAPTASQRTAVRDVAAAGLDCGQAIISRVLDDNPRAHRLLPRRFIDGMAQWQGLPFQKAVALFVPACAAVVHDDDYVIVTDSMHLPISRKRQSPPSPSAATALRRSARTVRRNVLSRFVRVSVQTRSSSGRATRAARRTCTTRSASGRCRSVYSAW
jgi:hypothetical protein